MRGVFYAVAAVAIAAPTVTALADNPVAPVDGGTLVQQCFASASSSVNDPGYTLCRSVEQPAEDAAAACRMPLRSVPGAPADATEPCGLIDGREVSEAKVAAYEGSWVHQALALQRDITEHAPFLDEQLVHTHNSFNSSAYRIPTDGSAPSYYPTLTNQDPNQVYSITDQLRMDVRVIEIDLHWVPSPYGSPATDGYWVTMCHGDGQDPAGTGYTVHVGCSDDRPLQDGLAEVRRWLDAHPDQFLMIYLENQLSPAGPVAKQEQAHDIAAQIIESKLGDRVYRPDPGLTSGNCQSMPYDVSADDVLSSGAQVLLVGNCGPGNAWNHWVFTRGQQWDESGDPTAYSASQCSADEAARQDGTSFRRFFEDRTWLSAMAGGTGAIPGGTSIITPQTTAEMTQCGVNIIGFDQLQPFDGRLEASVWSWAKDEPTAAGSCAFQGADGRFHAGDCAQPRHYACLDADGTWQVTSFTGPFRLGRRLCARRTNGAFAVPVNGYRQAQLALAKPPGVSDVWVNYRIRGGTWQASTPRYLPGVGLPHVG
jgi:hypothetical protein